MFGLSFWEIAIIFVVVLIVLGPNKLPEIARSLGKGLREFRKATDDFKSTVNDEMYKAEPPKFRQELPDAPAQILPSSSAQTMPNVPAASLPTAPAVPSAVPASAPASAPAAGPAGDVPPPAPDSKEPAPH